MSDEKGVHLQDEPSQVRENGLIVNVMVKLDFIYDGKDIQERRSNLQNSIVYSSIDCSLGDKLLDIITQRYDIDKIKKIHISGMVQNGLQPTRQPYKVLFITCINFNINGLCVKCYIMRMSVGLQNPLNNSIKYFNEIATSLIYLDSNEPRIDTRCLK